MSDPAPNGHTTTIPQGGWRFVMNQLVSRLGLAHALGATHAGVRQIEEVLGYKPTLTYADFKRAYLRYDLAQRLVNCYPEDTWGRPPTVREETTAEVPTAFEQAWTTLVQRFDLYTQLHLTDVQAQLGHYAILLLGLRGQEDLSQPAQPVRSVEDVLYVQRYSEEFATITAFGEDPNSPEFGRPRSYQIANTTDTDDALRRHRPAAFTVHASRVIHVPGEYRLDDDIYGLPVLEAVYNKLVDLLQVVGGSAYMFWTDAKRRIVLALRDGTTMSSEQQAALSAEAEEFDYGLRNFLRVMGMDVQQLAGTVASPKDHFEVLIRSIAGTRAVPQRILLGTEEGRLAGVQDDEAYLRRVARRQARYAETQLLRPLLDRCLALRILPMPTMPYVVEWDNLLGLSEPQQALVAKDVATAVSTYAGPGLASVVVPPRQFVEEYLGIEFQGVEDLQALLPTDEGAQPEDEADEEEAPEEEGAPDEEDEA